MTHILRVNHTEMAGDGPGQPACDIFLAQNVFFKNISFDFLNSRSLPYGGLTFKYTFKMH